MLPAKAQRGVQRQGGPFWAAHAKSTTKKKRNFAKLATHRAGSFQEQHTTFTCNMELVDSTGDPSRMSFGEFDAAMARGHQLQKGGAFSRASIGFLKGQIVFFGVAGSYPIDARPALADQREAVQETVYSPFNQRHFHAGSVDCPA